MASARDTKMYSPLLRPAGRHLLCLLARTIPSDLAFLRLVRQTALAGLPRAQAHLDHFLEGSGQSLTFATADLLAAEPGLCKVVQRAMVSGQMEVPISQLSWTNRDWAWALGSVYLCLSPQTEEVLVEVKGAYRWHPTETRLTQAVHQAAARLVVRGQAKAFSFAGQATRLRLEDIPQGFNFFPSGYLPIWQKLWGPV